MGVSDLPHGAETNDQRWQDGYYEGCHEVKPSSDDAIYVSGWCYGFCGGCQCSLKEAEDAYFKTQQGIDPKEWL